jgi:hypothetical protein
VRHDEGSSSIAVGLVGMAEEFDRGWYVRKGASPFTPESPAFFTHAEISEVERLLIRYKPSQPDRD